MFCIDICFYAFDVFLMYKSFKGEMLLMHYLIIPFQAHELQRENTTVRKRFTQNVIKRLFKLTDRNNKKKEQQILSPEILNQTVDIYFRKSLI